MKKITLIGNISCGKSTAAKLFDDALKCAGIKSAILDFDKLGYKALENADVQAKLHKQFGDFNSRAELAKLAFANSQNTELLNSIVEVEIKKLYSEQMFEYQNNDIDYVIVEQSVYKGQNDKFASDSDYLICVAVNNELRKQRWLQKGLDEQDFENRDSSQLPLEAIVRSCNYVVENVGSTEDLKWQIDNIVDKILRDK